LGKTKWSALDSTTLPKETVMPTLNANGVTDHYGAVFVEKNAYHMENACTTGSNISFGRNS
jgi:hypothetical protein